MNLQEQISRMKSMMGLLIEDEQKVYESKPIILIGPQGSGKSTTAEALAKKTWYTINPNRYIDG